LLSVCVSLYPPPNIARQRLGKTPLIGPWERLGKNPPIVARQRLDRNVIALTNIQAKYKNCWTRRFECRRFVLPRTSCFVRIKCLEVGSTRPI
jgi:hypothetical protein